MHSFQMLLAQPHRPILPAAFRRRRAEGERPMKIAVRALGILLLLGALAAGAAQFQMWAVSGRFVPLPLRL